MTKKYKSKPEVMEFYKNFKSMSSCVECGETHDKCLEFHHVDEKSKLAAVSALVWYGATIEKVRAEIAKCIVLCCNCHRKLHDGEPIATGVRAGRYVFNKG